MGKFVKPVGLMAALCDIVESAQKEIHIMCPFTILNHNFKRALDVHKDNADVHISILYGKFTNNDHYCLSKQDLEY